MRLYRKDAILLERVGNGFILTTKGTREEQEDNLDGVYVFQEIQDMNKWIVTYFDKTEEEKL